MSRGTLDPAGSALASDTGLSPSLAGCSKAVLLPLLNPLCSPNPAMHASRFGLFRVRSPLLTESNVSFSSSGYLDVSVPRVPFHKLWIHLWMTVVHTAGFPHSEISGSKDICSSPKLIAAYHVFHRLSVPRHPPCALLRLTFVCPFPKKWLPPVPPSVENIRRMSKTHVFVFRLAIGRIDLVSILSYHRNLMSLSNVSSQCPISSPLTLPLDSCCRTIACFFCSNVWKYISAICIIRSLHCSFYRKLSVCSFQGTNCDNHSIMVIYGLK